MGTIYENIMVKVRDQEMLQKDKKNLTLGKEETQLKTDRYLFKLRQPVKRFRADGNTNLDKQKSQT